QEPEDDIFHAKSMKLIEAIRLAYPDKDNYETEAIGHRFSMLQSDHDSSVKKVPLRMLPYEELVDINSTFINLVNFMFRPTSWMQFTAKLLDRRQLYVDVLTKQLAAFISYHKEKNLSGLARYVDNFSSQYDSTVRGHSTIQLPQTIV